MHEKRRVTNQLWQRAIKTAAVRQPNTLLFKWVARQAVDQRPRLARVRRLKA